MILSYKDPDQQRQAQNIWMWRRRATWIAANGPCAWCGSTQELKVSWKNPATRTMKTTAIWSRTEETRLSLLAECEVMCDSCYKKKIKIWRAIRAAYAA